MTCAQFHRSPYGMNARSKTVIVLGMLLVLGVYEGLRRGLPASSPVLIGLITMAVGMPVVSFLSRRIAYGGMRDVVVALSDGLLSLSERDYSLKLSIQRRDEIGLLIHRFNALAATLRRERNDVYQRQILLETVLEQTSMIVVICNEAMRIVYANGAARGFFGEGKRPEGQDLRALIECAPAEIRDALDGGQDLLVACDRSGAGEPETFHITKRYFELSTQKHTVFILRPMTKELARKEVETWKTAIRVISHEVNNSLAPISSLVHSARLMLDKPAHAQRLASALDTIDDRARHLKSFLDGYASFARLPRPNRKPISWRELLGGVEGLYAFKVEGEIPDRPALVDPAQMQQVLINLLKNAAESGSPADEIRISFPRAADGTEIVVLDRGKGMTGEVLKNALVPFYSTKKAGTGLGLALCREIVDAHGGRLSLHPRDGGGVAVRCWIPAAA